MIRENRIILKRIQKLSCGTSTRILTIKGRLVNPETGQSIDCRADYGKELDALINGLIRDGYLTQPEEFKVFLTDKGLHPYKYQWDAVKSIIFTSILMPIVVSVLTTLITLWLTGQP